MNWYPKLYLSESAKKNVRRTIYRLNHGKFIPGYYLITLSNHPEHLLEIIGSGYLASRGGNDPGEAGSPGADAADSDGNV